MRISERKYVKTEVITFRDTKGEYGALSNMAPNYSLFINEVIIPNTEVLYQACRFPLFPNIQKEIILQTSPMEAKKISRKYIANTRQDWEDVKFEIMRWCLRAKLIQNWDAFSQILLKTQDKNIVEYSTIDKVWAAIPQGDRYLVGKNALGRLLMELREEYVRRNIKPQSIKPISIPGFLLFNNEIQEVYPPEFFYDEDF